MWLVLRSNAVGSALIRCLPHRFLQAESVARSANAGCRTGLRTGLPRKKIYLRKDGGHKNFTKKPDFQTVTRASRQPVIAAPVRMAINFEYIRKFPDVMAVQIAGVCPSFG
jgi:hypothetical protein